MRAINIDTANLESMIELMDNSDQFRTSLIGENSEGEIVISSIYSDYICMETQQNNGWVRKMYYWKDGTVEEMYDGRWDEDPDKDCYIEDNVDITRVPASVLIKELRKRGYKVSR